MRVEFVCSADPRFGFGHLARCMAIASLAQESAPDLSLGFRGSFTPPIEDRLRRAFPEADVAGENEIGPADVVVVDRLGAPDELDSHPLAQLRLAAKRGGRAVYLASGRTAPSGPWTTIGYQPGGPRPSPPALLWGLEYAPVAPRLMDEPGEERRKSRALVALGGHRDDRPIRLALAALAELPQVAEIDVLLSPATPVAGALQAAERQRLTLHRSTPSVGPLLRRAGVAIASYGNLAFEALALGAPLCLLAQKAFQERSGRRLAEAGLAVSAGAAQAADPEGVARAVSQTLAEADRLSLRGPRAVDGLGLRRIAHSVVGDRSGAQRCASSA